MSRCSIVQVSDGYVTSCLQQTREEQPRFSSLRIILGSLLALLLLLPALMFGWKPMWSSSISDVSAVVLAQHMSPAVVVSEVTPAAASPSASIKKTKIKHKKKAAASAADSRATDGGMNGLQSNGDEHGVAVNGDLSQQHAQLQPSPSSVSDSLAPPISADCAVNWPSVPRSPEPGSLSPVPAGSGGGAAGSEGGAGQLGTRSYVDDDGAVVIGRLRVGPGILGYGSAGEHLNTEPADGGSCCCRGGLIAPVDDAAGQEVGLFLAYLVLPYECCLYL